VPQPERLVDAEELEELAKLLTDRRQLTEHYYARAGQIIGLSQAAPLVSVLRWATQTPAELRDRAGIARAAEKGGNPFGALTTFGLSTAIGGISTKDGVQLTGDLKAVISQNASANPDAKTAAIREFFAKLPKGDRSWLVVNQPALVGGLDGAPATVRYAANRLLIERALTHEQAELAQLKVADPTNSRLVLLQKRVARMSEFLQARVTPDGPKPRQFLLFDPAADGRVAEVFGDLANAKHVAVMVPGVNNRLDNYDGFAVDAERLMKDRATGRELPETAVITWLGYDTPGLGDAPLQNKAEAGAPDLHLFRSGLEAAEGARFALFAHSYGTLLSSKALQQGAPFDSVVFMGSPGLGPNVRSATDLNLATGTEVFAMRAPGDWISYTEAHGKDPAGMAGVRRLATGRSHGHSEYYMDENTALENLQTVLTGGGCVQTFMGSPKLDDEQLGAGNVRVLIKEMQSRVPQWKTAELGVALDSVIKRMSDADADAGTLVSETMKALVNSNLIDYFTIEDVVEIIGRSLAETGLDGR
jgi:hypothetical protein